MKIFAVYFLALFVIPGLSWWENGHMLVAQVAKLDLLQNHPEVYPYAEDTALLLAPFTFNLSTSFIESAVWPDDIKRTGWNFWDDWHFLDRPYDPSGEFSPQNDGEANSPWGINQTLTVLMDNVSYANITIEKSMMIRMLMHLVGDMHQPLHNTEYYSIEFPDGDQGGNLINVTLWDGEQTELHYFWDSIAEELGTYNRPLNQSSFEFFEEYGLGLMKDFPRSIFVDELNITDPVGWSWGVHLQAVEYAYNLLPSTFVITKDYQTIAYQVCRNNLALAGYRLSDMIWYALGNQIPPRNSTNSTTTESDNEGAPSFGLLSLLD